MLNFCTLFDSAYLSRGLALYESLKKNCEQFHLYIFAFDDACHHVLKKMGLSQATILSLEEFEDSELLKIKATRTKAEYCWTCTPSTILYVMENYDVDRCTYLDADLYFYSSPEVLLNELGDNSVMITEHRYTPRYDQSKKSGKYCVQFVPFKNNEKGLKVLRWWRDACIDWCYSRLEDGKFGDQKYLDDWPERFGGVHVMQYVGGGIAPWNIQQYEVYEKRGVLVGREINTGKEFVIIFYHFHHVKFYTNGEVDIGGYKLLDRVKGLIYQPYLKHLGIMSEHIAKVDGGLDPHGSHNLVWNDYKNTLRYIKHKILHNVVDKHTFLKLRETG